MKAPPLPSSAPLLRQARVERLHPDRIQADLFDYLVLQLSSRPTAENEREAMIFATGPFHKAARLLALAAALIAALRLVAMTFAAFGQICNSELVSVLISMIRLAQLVAIGVGESLEAASRKLAATLYLAAAALLVPQQLLIASC